MDRIQPRKKRKSKYTDAQLEACRAYWNAAQTNVEVKHAINTRITYESVFSYYSRQLAKTGVESVGRQNGRATDKIRTSNGQDTDGTRT